VAARQDRSGDAPAADTGVRDELLPEDASPPAKLWSEGEVIRWLMDVAGGKLAYLIDSFESNGVDGELLLDLSNEACDELGVKHLHRKMLLREVEKLQKG
jgi:hypothetical protein